MRIELPRPHAGQRRILEERKRYTVVRCGRRWGKTVFGEVDIVPTALSGEPTGWFAPTYKYLDEPWRDINRILAPAILSSSKQEKRIILKGGGCVDFWTMDDPDCGRSRKYRKVVIDEAGLVPTLGDIFWGAIKPTLTDLRGEALFLGTPKGRRAIQEFFAKGEQGDQDWAAFRGRTRDNPYIPSEEIDEAEAMYRKAGLYHIFLQEFEGIPADDGGNPFGLKAIRSCVKPTGSGEPVVYGVDLAKSEDFTVVIGLDEFGNVVVIERWQQDWGATKSKLRNLLGRTPVVMDSTGVGDPIVEGLQSDGLLIEGFHFSATSKQQLMEGLRDAIQSMEVSYPDGWLVNELESFEFEYSKRGVRYSAPTGLHDDGVCALALAVHGLKGRTRNDFAFEAIEI